MENSKVSKHYHMHIMFESDSPSEKIITLLTAIQAFSQTQNLKLYTPWSDGTFPGITPYISKGDLSRYHIRGPFKVPFYEIGVSDHDLGYFISWLIDYKSKKNLSNKDVVFFLHNADLDDFNGVTAFKVHDEGTFLFSNHRPDLLNLTFFTN